MTTDGSGANASRRSCVMRGRLATRERTHSERYLHHINDALLILVTRIMNTVVTSYWFTLRSFRDKGLKQLFKYRAGSLGWVGHCMGNNLN